MRYSNIITLVAAVVLIFACFSTWVIIQDPSLSISGVDTTGTRFGKPGYNHFILTALILILTFIPKIWAKRMNLLFAALNLAWAVRNFIILGRCEAGECPERQWGLYLALIASIIIMIATLFPNVKMKQDNFIESSK